MFIHSLFRLVIVGVSMIAFWILGGPSQGHETNAVDAEYVRVTVERATKIVQSLGLSDDEQASRVSARVAKFYQDLRRIHQQRDEALKRLQGGNPHPLASQLELASIRGNSFEEVQTMVEALQGKLHYAFVASLSAELPADKVDQIKEGLTYGVARNTYKYYLELYPSLDEQQKRDINAMLLEAREHAMDAGSSNEKHALFGKYKGRINNYLSKAGFDAKEAERLLKERQNRKP